MACYSPLRAFRIPYEIVNGKQVIAKTKNGKPKYKICPTGTSHIYFRDGEWRHSAIDIHGSDELDYSTEFIEVPCGKCLGCQLDYAKQWADRCLLELQCHESSYFITLTYDDEHLPLLTYQNIEGKTCTIPTLVKKDVQRFTRHLRQHTGQKIRFYLSGEYGDDSGRPHYHLIAFGLKLDDLVLYSKNFRGDCLYNSETIDRAWSDDYVSKDKPYTKRGHAVVGDVTYESCSYTARYVVKKAFKDMSLFYDTYGVEPEFTLMSRKPGIGAEYFEKHKDIMNLACFYVSTEDGAKQIVPPRYFHKLYEKDIGSEEYRKYKAKHNPDLVFNDLSTISQSEVRNRLKCERTSNGLLEMLRIEADVKAREVKVLQRKEI